MGSMAMCCMILIRFWCDDWNAAVCVATGEGSRYAKRPGAFRLGRCNLLRLNAKRPAAGSPGRKFCRMRFSRWVTAQCQDVDSDGGSDAALAHGRTQNARRLQAPGANRTDAV